MWAVDDSFIRRLAGFKRLSTLVTATPPGGDPVTVELKAGTVTVDSAAFVRRRASLTALTTADDFDVLTAPGCLFRIETGFDDGTNAQRIPVFTGELSTGGRDALTGATDLPLVDLGVWIQRARFLIPYTPAAGTSRRAVIANLVTDARPGTVVIDSGSDTGTVQTTTWSDGRDQAINDLGSDAGVDSFFRPDGAYLIQPTTSLSSQPVWTIRPGRGGTLKTANRKRPLDKLYNTVVVRPSKGDGSQTWTQQVAQVTDVAHPRHPSKIGVVPYFYASPTIATADAALAVAATMLDRVLGNLETLSIDALSNPALEAGDVIRVVTPVVGTSPAQTFQHFVDSFTLDLLSGGMNLSTRAVNLDTEAA